MNQTKSAKSTSQPAFERPLYQAKRRATAKRVVAKAAKKPAAKKAARTGRGELKNQVFAALQSAGAAGVRVKDLAKKLGTKPVNIHAWFHAALKRYPNVQKIEGGHYRLKGKGGAPVKAAKPAKAAKAAKPAKKAAGKGASKVKRSPRGELTSRILAQLKSAGKLGKSIKDLAAKVGAPYKNISIWFATTGKKNRLVKKVGRGVYSLK